MTCLSQSNLSISKNPTTTKLDFFFYIHNPLMQEVDRMVGFLYYFLISIYLNLLDIIDTKCHCLFI